MIKDIDFPIHTLTQLATEYVLCKRKPRRYRIYTYMVKRFGSLKVQYALIKVRQTIQMVES